MTTTTTAPLNLILKGKARKLYQSSRIPAIQILVWLEALVASGIDIASTEFSSLPGIVWITGKYDTNRLGESDDTAAYDIWKVAYDNLSRAGRIEADKHLL